MSELTCLELEEIFGNNITEEQIMSDNSLEITEIGDGSLDIFKKRGTKAAVTDFSILLGAGVSSRYHVEGDSSLEGRTANYWMKTYRRSRG